MKLKDKQPGIEEKEGTMSRHLDAVATSTLHLDAVATSTLNLKQLRHHLKRKNCRDNIRMSRQQLYREEVATTSGCRDNSCTEKLSRQHQDVATTIVLKRGRDNTRLSRQQLQGSECRDDNKLSRRRFQ